MSLIAPTHLLALTAILAQSTAGANLALSGLGAAIDASWESSSRIVGGTRNLRFSGLATINLRLFANLGQRPGLIAAATWLRGTRLSLAITNLCDTLPRVRDPSGKTPI